MGKRKERDSIIFINDHMELAETMLTESELGRLYIALRRYSIEGVVGNFATESSGWRAIFTMMRSAQDKAIRRYEETCERNRVRVLKRYTGATAGSNGSRGSQSYQSNLIQSNLIESNLPVKPDVSSLRGKEETGVTGIAWL